MSRHFSPSETVAELADSTEGKNHLIVEGRDDQSFFRNVAAQYRRRTGEDLEIHVAGCRNSVLSIFDQRKAFSHTNVVFFVDRDFRVSPESQGGMIDFCEDPELMTRPQVLTTIGCTIENDLLLGTPGALGHLADIRKEYHDLLSKYCSAYVQRMASSEKQIHPREMASTVALDSDSENGVLGVLKDAQNPATTKAFLRPEIFISGKLLIDLIDYATNTLFSGGSGEKIRDAKQALLRNNALIELHSRSIEQAVALCAAERSLLSP